MCHRLTVLGVATLLAGVFAVILILQDAPEPATIGVKAPVRSDSGSTSQVAPIGPGSTTLDEAQPNDGDDEVAEYVAEPATQNVPAEEDSSPAAEPTLVSRNQWLREFKKFWTLERITVKQVRKVAVDHSGQPVFDDTGEITFQKGWSTVVYFEGEDTPWHKGDTLPDSDVTIVAVYDNEAVRTDTGLEIRNGIEVRHKLWPWTHFIPVS